MQLKKIGVLVSFALASTLSQAAIVGPVNVLEVKNDGSRPAACTGSLNVNVGGIAEMALDLDQDGVADVCFGSRTSNCGAGFNFDAFTTPGTLLMSVDGSNIMNGTSATFAFWEGKSVGPFQAASGATNSANIGAVDQPMVFGFKGGSNTANTEVGQFSFTVKSADCSIDFGKVDYKSGANTFSNDVVAGGTNGACGSSANVATAFLPTANLCGAGTTGTVTPGTSSWGWSCTGTGAGATNATCSAPYTAVNGGGGTVGAIHPAATNNWQVRTAESGFVALPAPAPSGVTFPGGATKVVLDTGTPGTSATVVLRYSSIPAGSKLYKYGKQTGPGDTNKWFEYPATIDYAAGTVTYTLTDGQKGDNDWTVNGVIDDPVGLGVGAVTGVPTLSQWAMILLSVLMALATLVTLRRRTA